MTATRSFLFLLSLILPTRLLAQSVPPLDRLISVDIRSQPVREALRQISRTGRFEFSYNPTRVDRNALVTVRLNNVPVHQVLDGVFARMTYKSRGNHVILLPADPPDPASKNFQLDGYILDELTGQRIAQASVFEKTTLASTVSNPFGYYRIRLPTNQAVVRLDVRKQAYVGETVTIRAKTTHAISILLMPLPRNIPVQALSIRVSADTTRPTVLLPLATALIEPIPPLMAAIDSTPPGTISSALERGRDGMTRLFVSAKQAVHDINLSRDTLYRDWQVSFVPTIGTNLRLSGRIINRFSVNALAGYSFGVRAVEVGGLFNLVRADVRGVQVAGLGNVVGRQVDGVQVSGLFNIDGGTVRGVQIGGLFNVTGGELTRALQVGGLVNVAGQSIDGLQLAGLVNYAPGTVPLGLFSHVQRGGFRRLELSADEVNVLNVTYRTGVRQLYNIVTAGSSFGRPGSPRLRPRYGVWLVAADAVEPRSDGASPVSF